MNTVPSKPAGPRLLPPVLALALCAAIPAMAQEAAPAAEPAADAAPKEEVLRFDSAITPEAREIMERMKASLNGLQRVSVTAEVSRDETLSYGYKLQHNEFVKMDLERSTKLKVDVSGDFENDDADLNLTLSGFEVGYGFRF